MTGRRHNDSLNLIATLSSRGIAVDVKHDRLEVSPKSRLTSEDRESIRRLKVSLIDILDPCGSHFDPSKWKRIPILTRPGWEQATCGRCGRFIGANPIQQRPPARNPDSTNGLSHGDGCHGDGCHRAVAKSGLRIGS